MEMPHFYMFSLLFICFFNQLLIYDIILLSQDYSNYYDHIFYFEKIYFIENKIIFDFFIFNNI